METWRDTWSKELGLDTVFVQDNHARSEEAGVLRGLHYQAPPMSQAKLVWVTMGRVYDIAVDLRKGSPSYGKWHGIELSAHNALRFFIPRGFAHGYITLDSTTEFQYKVDNYYSPEHEGGLLYNDPSLNIDWQGNSSPILSDKDLILPTFASFDSPFRYGENC